MHLYKRGCLYALFLKPHKLNCLVIPSKFSRTYFCIKIITKNPAAVFEMSRPVKEEVTATRSIIEKKLQVWTKGGEGRNRRNGKWVLFKIKRDSDSMSGNQSDKRCISKTKIEKLQKELKIKISRQHSIDIIVRNMIFFFEITFALHEICSMQISV